MLPALRLKAARYVLVGGGIGAIVEFLLFVALTRLGGGLQASNLVAFHGAFLLCYVLHYHYTYERPYAGTRSISAGLAKYAALVYFQLLLGALLLWFFIERLLRRPDASKFVQMALVMPASYFIQKALIFRRSGSR